jgi:hypothetical protein
MEEVARSGKILWTAEAICKYLGVSRGKFYTLVRAGLPAVIIDGAWCAYVDNLELFFKHSTAKVTKNIPEDAE